MRAVSKLGWSVCFLLAAATAGSLYSQVAPPQGLDPTQGQIGGRVALAFVPTEPGGGLVRDPTSYQVILASAAGLENELSFPAGRWFQPPPGKYRVWVEGKGRMAAETVVVGYAGSPFVDRGLVGHVELGPAGTVALAAEIEAGPDLALRLIHLDSHLRRGSLHYEVSRRVTGPALRSGALMPTGKILAALYDSRRQEVVGLTRPLTVAAGARLPVKPAPPKSGSHLLVLLDRPTVLSRFEEDDVRPTLAVAGKAVPPDVLIPTADRIYAVWYDLVPGTWPLEVRSSRVFLKPQDVRLLPRKTERLTLSLQKRPDLRVFLEAPEGFPAAGAELEVTAQAGAVEPLGKKVLTAELPAPPFMFESLPPSAVLVSLRSAAGLIRKRVDLSDGRDQEMTLQVQSIFLRGTVYRGERPHPATISFQVGDNRIVEATTDEEGTYEAVLYRPVAVASVQLLGTTAAPFFEMFANPVSESGVLDFHIPGTDARARVVDEESGAGIAEARLSVTNTSSQGKISSQSSSTDREGWAPLPPLRSGEVALAASAEGYLPSAQPVKIPVREEEPLPEITLRLRPARDRHALLVQIAQGAPAAEAELRAVSASGLDVLSWSTRADAEGRAEIPKEMAGSVLLIRHPGHGFLARLWPGPADSGETTWVLPPLSAPLVVRTVDGGDRAVPFASVALWVDGIRLAGEALSWLTGAVAASNGDGVWVASQLPTGSAEVLAWRRADFADGLETFRQAVQLPLGEPLVLRVAN